MRYIGNKRNLIDDIEGFIKHNITDGSLEHGTFLDLFGGANSVSTHFKTFMPVITNDIMYFSYVLSRGMVVINSLPDFNTLAANIAALDVLDYLNNLPTDNLVSGFIANNYTLFDSEREYLSIENGQRVDTIRTIIESWYQESLIDSDGYYYLLACLICAISKVSNTNGSFASFLKEADARSTLKLTLTHPVLINNHVENKAYCLDAMELLSSLQADICYIDPPYTQQQYSSNYHLLETVCMNDTPLIKGKTGVRQYKDSQKSKFSSKVYATQELYRLIEACQSPHIVISYTSRGIITAKDIKQALAQFCDPKSIVFHEFSYHTHKGNGTKNGKKHCEYLFYANKPEFSRNFPCPYDLDDKPTSKLASYDLYIDPNQHVLSPINYPNNQQDYLSDVLALMPKNIGGFVDLFAGGMSVSLNVVAPIIYANDVNKPVVDMLEYIASTDLNELMVQIQNLIDRYDLSRVNAKGFRLLRDNYNKSPSAIGLYMLITHSYNSQFRFNTKGEYNACFGLDRASFSDRVKRDLISYSRSMAGKNVVFSSLDYESAVLELQNIGNSGTFYYCHPPSYLSSKKIGVLEAGASKWSERKQKRLYEALDVLHDNGVRFMLVGLTHCNTEYDDLLIKWASSYKQVVLSENKELTRIAVMNY